MTIKQVTITRWEDSKGDLHETRADAELAETDNEKKDRIHKVATILQKANSRLGRKGLPQSSRNRI